MKLLLSVDVMHSPPEFVEALATTLPLEQSDVTLLFVKNITPAYENVINSMGDFADDWGHQIEKKAHEKLDPLQKALEAKGAKVTIKFISGNPAQSIADMSKKIDADVTCVFPLKHGKVEEFFVGSTSRKVAKLNPGTTLVLRPGKNDVKHVVFAFDGSKDAVATMNKMATMLKLKERDVQVSVLHVVTVPQMMAVVPEVNFALEKNLLMQGEMIIADALKQMKDLGLSNVNTELATGEPADVLIEFTKKKNADLIVMGAKGHTALEHIILGSVTDRIVTHAPVSVIIGKSGQ